MKFSVGRILESDLLGIAAMDCNDGNVKGFVGYKYPTYSCCLSEINAWATSAPPTLAENVFTVFRRRLRQEVFRRRLRPSESSKQWFERQRTRACVPHTPYTSVLKFVPPAGRVCGAATNAVGGGAGYGLLFVI